MKDKARIKATPLESADCKHDFGRDNCSSAKNECIQDCVYLKSESLKEGQTELWKNVIKMVDVCNRSDGDGMLIAGLQAKFQISKES